MSLRSPRSVVAFKDQSQRQHAPGAQKLNLGIL